MKRLFTYVIVFCAFFQASAQSKNSGPFNLEQCIRYALENAVNVKNAQLGEDIAKAKVRETIGIGLPQIDGSVGITHNQQLPRFFAAYQPGGFFDFSSVPGIQPGDVVASQNFFQLKSSGNANLAINQLIFNGSYLVGLKAASTYKDLAYRTTDQTKQEIIQGVTKAYYAVLINKERTTLFDANIARVDTLLRNTTALNQNGFAESIDVDRVKVTLNNLRTSRDQFLNLNELGVQLLKFQMNFPQDQLLEVSGSIQDMTVDPILMDTTVTDWDYKDRPDYRLLEVNKRLQELSVKNSYAAGVPVISAFANLGYTSQSPNIGGLFTTNSSFSDNGSVGPDKWYGFSNFGLSMNIPIFSGLQRTYRVQQEKLKLLQVNNNFINLKNGIDLEVKQATVNFDNAMKALSSQRENQDLAANVARVTKIKYEQGVGSSLEVTDAEDALRTAQTNYFSALFDAMVAKVDLEKAFGKLLPAYVNTDSSNPDNK